MNELPMNAEQIFQIVVIVAFIVLVPFGIWMKKDTEKLLEEKKSAFERQHSQEDQRLIS